MSSVGRQTISSPLSSIDAPAPCGRSRKSFASGRHAGLLSGNFSQRIVDPILPAWSGFLEVLQYVPIDAQGDQFLGVRHRRPRRNRLQRLRRGSLERRFGRLPCVDGSSYFIPSHLTTCKFQGQRTIFAYRRGNSSPGCERLPAGGRGCCGLSPPWAVVRRSYPAAWPGLNRLLAPRRATWPPPNASAKLSVFQSTH